MWRRTDPAPAGTLEPQQMPRDVETMERVVEALDAGVSTVLEAHVAVVRTILETCGPGYAAVWLPDGADSSSLTWEGGPLTPAMAATWPRDGRLDAVQAPITDVLEEQVRMARSIETSA